jgi:hypothetical protein
MTHEDLVRLGNRLVGTCDSVETACEQLGLPVPADPEDAMLNVNVERCSVCDWWHESFDLAGGDDEEDGICQGCR